MTEEEKFFAWIDGELTPAEGAEVEARVAADPRLQRLAKQHRAFAAHLQGAFDPILAAQVPGPLQTALHPRADIIDFESAKRARRIPPVAHWTALAATLVVGVFLGTMVPKQGTAPVAVEGGKIYAAAALNQALETQLASASAGDVRIGLTFRDRSGDICRTFTDSGSNGLACHSRGRWQLKGLFAAPEGQSGDYRMAAGMDPNLAALVSSTMTGEPLDASGERAERDKGWL